MPSATASGHGVGLEIHEAPVASPRGEAPLPAGSIVTAEPGIYLPGKFGVRIEDMLYVIEDGCIDLDRCVQAAYCSVIVKKGRKRCFLPLYSVNVENGLPYRLTAA